MFLNRSKRRLWGSTAAAWLAVFPLCGAFAQTFPAPVAPGGLMNPDDPSVILSNNLKILAQNPYNVDALLAAGTGSMAAGDPNAAIGFLARAEELSPRNGKVKAALGAALTQIERPVEALRIFADAVALGVPEIEIAGDRGLAWDLRGDQLRAQKDYALSLKRGRNDEVARRYALSLGISGEREDAMKLIDPLTKRGDQGAWRAKAFILAMNGDMNGADRILSAVMPANMIGVMSPFMRRLPSLSQAQRAQAVNFGTMPATGTSVAVVDPGDSFKSIGTGVNVGLAGASPAAPVQVARVDLARPTESARDRKKREKQERELAKLAERGRQQAGTSPVRLPVGSAALPRPSVASAPVRLPPVKVATQTATLPPVQPSIAPAPRPPAMTAPTQSARPIVGTPPQLDQRVGRKIADVDPSRLPPEFRPNAGDSASKALSETRVTVVEGARTLPLPDGVTPRPNIAQPAVAGPVTGAIPATMPAPRPVLAPVPAPIPVSLPALEPAPVKAPEPVRVAAVVGSAAVAPPGSAVVPTPAGLSDVVVKVEPAKVDPIKVASALPAPSPAQLTTPLPAPTPATVTPPNASPVAAAPLASATPQGAGVTAPAVKLPDPVPGFSLSGASTPVDPASIPVLGNMPAVQPAVAAPTASDLTPPPTPPVIGVASAVIPVVAQTEVALAPVNVTSIEAAPAAGLESVFEGLQIEDQSTAGPIPTDEEFRARQLAAKRKADAAAKLAADEKAKLKLEADAKTKKEVETKAKAALELEKEKEEAALAKANPARLWVQVATGANKSGLPITWRKLKTDAPKSLSGQSAWYVPFRATNRLLIGPFKSSSEARIMIGKLSKEGVSANSFSSDAGVNIVRLGGR